MMTVRDNPPKFYRAIHFPYGERNNSKPSGSVSKQPANPTLKQCKKLTNSTEDQYIKLRNPDAGGLPYSAKLRCGDTYWKLHGDGCLVTIGSDYVAQVSIEHIPELDDMSDFEASKELLLANLKIDNVLFDQLVKQTTDTVGTIKSVLHDLAVAGAVDPNSAKCLLELWRIADEYNFKISIKFSDEINSNEIIQHTQLKAVLTQYAKQTHKLEERSLVERGKSWIQGLMKKNFFGESLTTVIKNHKTIIMETCTSYLKQNIAKLEPHSCLLLTKNDVKLFSDLECALSESEFKEALPTIEMNFFKSFMEIKPKDYCQSLPLVNNVYFHVCKSMLEMANRVEAELSIKKILTFENMWKITPLQESANVASLFAKCFIKQLQMLVKMANHFEPGKITVRGEFFYECQIKIFNVSQLVHDDLRIWLCLVDATMMHMFQGNTQRIEVYSAVLEVFHSYVSSNASRHESQESVRMVAHNTLEFVAQVEQTGLGNSAMDMEILRKQISFIGPEFLSVKMSLSRYRDLLDVFKHYWERFNEVLPKLTRKLEGNHLKLEVDEIKNLLSNIVSQVLDKDVSPEEVIKFFRAYNDLFTDMEDMPFVWYVRIQTRCRKNKLLQSKIIKRVENAYRNTDNECYQVQGGQNDRFVATYGNDEVPDHYQVEVVKTLLNNIEKIGRKQTWANESELSATDQLIATVLLINAVRSSLLYLKEQSDYVDFEKYYEESVKPFISVINDSTTLEDFTKRVELIKESFWYIRNQNSIGIDKAVELFEQHNMVFKEELLRTSFDRYNDQFLKYMVDCNKLSTTDKIRTIVGDVRSKAKPLLNTKWTAEFKQTTLPEVLAGLGAVWSIKISKDVANSGKHLKPHTIQILSILRLLSIDEGITGVQKHLAQILTGQGKSVVLGLVAAMLALFDHDVVVVCYSRYLANRDYNDFEDLFKTFSVDSKIYYQTFDDVAWTEMHKLYAKATKYVSKSIGIPDETQTFRTFASKLNNTVLLIDEVDVFFMDKFYGNSFNPLFVAPVRGLGKIQLQIWHLVHRNDWQVEKDIQSFINASDDPEVKMFRSLQQRPNRYKFLNIASDVTEVLHTNESLLSAHLQQMIETAILIKNRTKHDDWIQSFRIDRNGCITHKDDHGIFRTNCCLGYHNTFVYFKLREKNFVQYVNGVNNFGYLNLSIASFSYSKIPEKFPLILGVSGTLKELTAFEKDAIENHYQITQSSIMPSFFGCSNLKFNPSKNFQCHQKPIDWRKAIFTRVNAIINAHRSVIVFFDTETEITQFKHEFKSQLDRLNVITNNTEPRVRDRCIAEAGLSRTVTLATREMGRGVDYKSSLSVEKNGGIHIIQTFFSIDEKEETQIKGRTARKDNRGSYELILCHTHLLVLRLVRLLDRAEQIDYAFLLKSRDRLMKEDSDRLRQELERVNEAHEKSIGFCRKL
ncbi:uncharacterized protein LOC5571300 isoform X2 [Aedes aegypti]|nr:uncharacterized protein LOC5571300 isoform X2 [Aedes aegypti]XP_021695819.1 uncharacterized protein LOC5571300 isoform X2 [Aedes aegypti]XP_021695820.1 uncharacterized protein LOC5571300 isoform X2 [Aedes aegypti]